MGARESNVGFAADECVKTSSEATAAMIKPASGLFVGMAVFIVVTSLMPAIRVRKINHEETAGF